MALHITNPDADRLARQLAKKTGKGITEALIDALSETLTRLDADPADEADGIKRARAAIARFRAPFQDEDKRDQESGSGWGFGNRW